MGRPLLKALRARGEAVKAASRSGAAVDGAEGVVFDIANPATHAAAFEGVDRAYVMLPAGNVQARALLTQSGVPLNSIPWKVTPSPSGSGSGAQGLRLDPMAMVGAVFNGAVSMLARLENGEVPLVEDNPSFKSRPDDLKAALQALKKGLTETLASNPPANTSANTSANSSANTSASAVGGNAAPTRSRGLGTSVVTQPLPPSQTVATGQPQPQGVQTGGQGAPTAPSAQGTSESLSVLKLREEIADLEVVVQTHEVDPSKVSRAQADLAKKQVNALEAKINRIKAEEAIAARTQHENLSGHLELLVSIKWKPGIVFHCFSGLHRAHFRDTRFPAGNRPRNPAR